MKHKIPYARMLGYRKPTKDQQCTSRSGGVRCQMFRGHTTVGMKAGSLQHAARVGNGIASWG